nr:LuxR C-terminal-related transcriptional regulator [Ramlibacter paludis]
MLLKVTPPRVPRNLVARPALAARHPSLRDRPVVLVQAPAGFGKTSLLAQWRLEHLAEGAAVAWLQAQRQDEIPRFVQALALAVRSGAGRPTFGHVLLESLPGPNLEGVTAWLAELAQSALQVVLVVDEADRLPDASREALAYVLRNAPPNLRCIVAARSDCNLGLEDMVAYGHAVLVDAPQLRFSLAETIELMRQRFGDAAQPDAAARLHEVTEGWPLGLQLALSLRTTPADFSGMDRGEPHDGAMRERFVAHLLGNLDPADAAFLALVSVADPLHPDLCAALTQDAQAPQRLARLQRDTPIFTASHEGEWVRMHALARTAMRERFDALPADEQHAVRQRAAAWLADHAMLEEAASQLLSAGDTQQAYALAERSLYDSLMQQGRQGAVLEWLALLPPQELEHRPRLLLAAAWSLALSERNEEAQQLVQRLLAQRNVDESLRRECDLILGGAALFADEPDRFAELHRPWLSSPPLGSPLLQQVHANRCAFLALLEGEPALARLQQQKGPSPALSAEQGYLQRWSVFIIALSYLWEGQVLLADQLLRPVLALAEADLGRRSPFACALAALHASALWERDLPEEAVAVLANRLDVVERSGPPECVLLAYRTLARVAAASGAEHRTLELLGALDAVGIARKLPRLRVASLAEQVRVHARSGRGETCKALTKQLAEFLETPGLPQGPLWQRGVHMLQAATQGYAAIAAGEWRAALEPLARADAAALAMKQGRMRIELLGLRAYALNRCGERAEPLLREALELANSYGLQRVFADAHPALGAWVRELAGSGERTAAPAPRAAPAAAPAALPLPSMALTPKEREVLALLAKGLSNKEIGRALQVGEETVKWHLKNLFAKLDAGTRKQVVARARIFGLLAE